MYEPNGAAGSCHVSITSAAVSDQMPERKRQFCVSKGSWPKPMLHRICSLAKRLQTTDPLG
eukprot:scaffold116926_cov72-Phaeocystis_antarctica.AAC.2